MFRRLASPIDENGNLVVDSYKKQIETMIAQGAAAILSMGSMGQQAFLRNEVCAETAKVAVEAVKGRVPVYVGCMDNSISRAKARIASMEGMDLTAFVFTTPYYEVDSDAQCITYFKAVAAATKHGVILYDLPGVTNHKITYEMVCTLHEQVSNLIGIKSADLYMLRKLRLNPLFNDFKIFYSGLDAFDIAYQSVEKVQRKLNLIKIILPKKQAPVFSPGACFVDAQFSKKSIPRARSFLREKQIWETQIIRY